jgi:DNA-binding CsgD family transcriptional regulator
VWHQAAATLGPDEQVATALDQVATRAERRGAVTLAATALQRAAEFSAEPGRQGARLLRAAQLAFDSGQSELGSRLLDAVEPLDLPGEQRTLLSWLRQTQLGAGWTAAAKIGSFLAMADRMRADGHRILAAESLYTAAMRCWWANPDRPTRTAVLAAVDRLGLPETEPVVLAVLACTDPVGCGAAVTSRIAGLAPDQTDPAGMLIVGSAATVVWAYDQALGYLEVAVSGLRQQGRRGLLAQALVAQAWAAVHASRPQLATMAALEARALAEQTGQRGWATGAQFAQAAVAAEGGDFESAELLTCDAEAQLPAGQNPMLALACFVRGHGAIANRRYGQGVEQLRRVLDPADPAYHPFIGAWGLADLVEASAQTGDNGAAHGYLSQLQSLAEATSGPLLHAGLSYARPLVAADQEAEAHFLAALAGPLANWAGFRSRMLLWYGGWLRRQRRVTESRMPLRAAADGFDALEFRRLADTARQELRATGETTRRRAPDTWDQLTPRELQIAQLAADGLSNRQIGQQLYVSHRTVGYHLHQIFPKLGVTSRSQLHAALSGRRP